MYIYIEHSSFEKEILSLSYRTKNWPEGYGYIPPAVDGMQWGEL